MSFSLVLIFSDENNIAKFVVYEEIVSTDCVNYCPIESK